MENEQRKGTMKFINCNFSTSPRLIWFYNSTVGCAKTVLSGNPLYFRKGFEITFSWIDRKSPFPLIFGRFRFVLNNENTNSLQIEASLDMTTSASLKNIIKNLKKKLKI